MATAQCSHESAFIGSKLISNAVGFDSDFDGWGQLTGEGKGPTNPGDGGDHDTVSAMEGKEEKAEKDEDEEEGGVEQAAAAAQANE